MTDPQVPAEQSSATGSSGLPRNVAAALSYFLGAFTGIVFLLLEKKDPFVRFHAAQSIGVTVAVVAVSITLTILGVILGAVPILGWIIGAFLSLGFSMACFVFWLFLMYQAWQERMWEVPIIGARVRSMLLGDARVG